MTETTGLLNEVEISALEAELHGLNTVCEGLAVGIKILARSADHEDLRHLLDNTRMAISYIEQGVEMSWLQAREEALELLGRIHAVFEGAIKRSTPTLPSSAVHSSTYGIDMY